MNDTTGDLVKNIEGCNFGYTQSDEISLLLTDYENLNTCAWFDKKLQKIVSVASSMATLYFNNNFNLRVSLNSMLSQESYNIYNDKTNIALFDTRVFVLPKEEVCNYFIWRQEDCIRNAIEGLGQSKYSAKQLHGKTCIDIKNMLKNDYNIIFNDDVLLRFQRGLCRFKKSIEIRPNNICRTIIEEDLTIPLFVNDRKYVERYI